MPLGVWCAVAVEMKKAGQTRMAVFLVLSVSTYSRPAELFRCTTRCLPFLEALKQQPATAPLRDFQYGEYLGAFRQASQNLGLDLSPYQTRHSGPSIDRARNWRSLYEVQKRGNWKTYKSVARYEKAGRLSLSYQSLPRSLQVYTDLCEQCLGDVLLNRRPPPAAP